MDKFDDMFSGETKGLRRDIDVLPPIPPPASTSPVLPDGVEMMSLLPGSKPGGRPITSDNTPPAPNAPTIKHHTEKYYTFNGRTYDYHPLHENSNSRNKSGINTNYMIMAAIAGLLFFSLK